MEKAPLREELRAHPTDMTVDSPAVASALFEWLSRRLPATIAGYVALPDEVDVGTLITRLPGWRWVLPRVEDDLSLTFRDRSLDLEEHRWGMRQPAGSGPVIEVPEIDVFLVPGLAFDRTGARLGRGRGYYDRILAARAPATTVIGVTISKRVLESLPSERHDQRMDWLATEEGVIRCRPSP